MRFEKGGERSIEAALAEARKVLGEENVYGPEKIRERWGVALRPKKVPALTMQKIEELCPNGELAVYDDLQENEAFYTK